MPYDFTAVMSEHTDETLIQIVTTKRNDYQPAAVEAAEKEIERRSIDPTRIEAMRSVALAAAAEQELLTVNRTGLLNRFIHMIIDMLAFWILTLMVLTVIGLFFTAETDSQVTVISYLTYFACFSGYYIFMEYSFQKTLGKFITKSKVQNADGTRPQLGDIVGRTFCRLIPFDAISYLIMDAGFHDKWTNTTVIKE
jgi:uncharacterized RDD family membrane protein YckC